MKVITGRHQHPNVSIGPSEDNAAAEREAALGLQLEHQNICRCMSTTTLRRDPQTWDTFIIMGKGIM